MATSGAVTFDNILDDLEGILQTLQDSPNLSYGSLQDRLTWKPNLHLINYIRFLEQQGWVHYDRISDNLALTGDGDAALEDVDAWSGLAHDAFSEHISVPDSTDPEQSSYDDYDDYDDEGDATSVLNASDIDGVIDMTADVEFIEEGEGLSPSTDAEYDEGLYEDSIPDEVYQEQVDDEPSEPVASDDADHGGEQSYDQEDTSSDDAYGQAHAPEPEYTDPPAYESEPEVGEEHPHEDHEVSEEATPQPSHESATSSSSTHLSNEERYSRATSEQGRKPMSTSSYRSPASKSSSEGLYNREEEIGSGGIGTVYRGVQERLARPVAIKEIRNIFHVFADVQRDDIVRRFVEIVQTQASLDHPNIIQIYDVISDSDYPYVVMQYAPKGNLRNLIDTEGRPPLNVAMSYFMQILHALNSAHEQGIVHGGLKPENVVLDPAGNALLTDFGMTQVVERASGGGGNQVYVGVGTVAYMSPEQFMDPNLASVQSDIYSLGIMFYEMLTGKVPGRRSPMPSSFYPDIPRKLDDIFDKMSMDDREDRFTSVRDVLREIYNAPEVMEIMDKRSGVLFLRDPTVYGELGLGEGAEIAELPPADTSGDYGSYAVENSYEDYNEPAPAEHEPYVEDAHEEPELSHEEASEVVEAAAADVSEAEADAGIEDDSGVLDKLDKYGSLFDEDDE